MVLHGSNIQKALPCTNPRILSQQPSKSVQTVRDGKNKKGNGMEGKICYKNARSVIISHPCSGGPNDLIFTKFGTVLYRTYVNDLCKFWLLSVEGWAFCGCTKFTFSHDFNGWHYNRQALTCCRDCEPDFEHSYNSYRCSSF